MKLYGDECNLNHIDVSNFTDLSNLFINNSYGISLSKFNGDISQWDTSKINDMTTMFYMSQFNGGISNWDVSNVITMYRMFRESNFKKDISNWKPYRLDDMNQMFLDSYVPIPYWAGFKEKNKEITPLIVMS